MQLQKLLIEFEGSWSLIQDAVKHLYVVWFWPVLVSWMVEV